MAYQPKSYRKFVATAATATLVATAVTPAFAASVEDFKDVNSVYKPAVQYLLENEIAKGTSDTTFGTTNSITRGDAAVMIANVLGLDTENAENAGFEDLNSRVAGAVNALFEAKIVSGKTETEFKPQDNITRQEMAKIITNAYKLEAGDTKNEFTDVNSNWDEFVDALVENEITFGKTADLFAPTQNVTRGEFALFMFRAKAHLPGTVAEVKVENVKAINQSTLQVTGTDLDGLKAEDITVEGNQVTAVQASEDGTTATVSLAGTLPTATDLKVTVKDSAGSKDYTVQFNLEPKSVAVQAATYDDDTKNQKLVVSVDGVNTTVDYLQTAGYTVEFNAYDKDGNPANTTLFGAATPSTDGVIDGTAPITEGDYKVQVVVAKGSTVLTSQQSTITVRNLDNSATAISSYELTNYGVDGATAGGDDFKQSSSTLVFGDTAEFNKVVIGSGSSLSELTPGTFTLKSSNDAVVSVNSTNGTVTAEGLGTATVTITVGTVTKNVTLTVKGEERKATKATPEATSVKAIVGGTSAATVKVTDQYGDPVVGTTGLSVHYPTSVSGLSATPVALTTDSKGEASVSFAAVTTAGESGTVQVKKADGTVVGSFSVTTTAVDNAATQRLAYASASESKDDSINAELTSDDTITYKISTYTSENVFNGDLVAGDLTGYNVKFNGKVVSVNGNTTGSYDLTATDATIDVAIVDAGSTTLSVYKADGTLVGTKTITVAKGSTKITSVAWKATPTVDYSTTINYKTVLDITEAATGSDDIVKGITLSSPVVNKVRIDSAGVLYLDKNDNGTNDDASNIGTLTYSVSSSATGTFTAAGTPGNGFDGVTVATGTPAKGNVTFAVTDTVSSGQPVVGTKAVAVDVK